MTSTPLLSRPVHRARRPLADRLPLLTVRAMGAVLLVCLLVGLYAALAGGSAERVGSGPGGLGGVPQLLLLAIAAPLGLWSAVASRRRPERALLVFFGPLVVAFGFFFATHAVDPCATGIADRAARLGGVPLCETTGGYLEIHTRFHLLEHAVVDGALLAAYVAVLRAVDTRRVR